jgi:hypothetical protein
MPAAQTALVIGGGIAGPVAATALGMAGVDAAVYETRPADPVSANGIGGSLALEPNGLAALRIIGADDAVRAAAVPITRSMMSIASKPGRELPAATGFHRVGSSTAASCTASCANGLSKPVCGSTTPSNWFVSTNSLTESPPTSPTAPAPAPRC